ncbi:MAG: acylase [Acidobacteriota bacterium]
MSQNWLTALAAASLLGTLGCASRPPLPGEGPDRGRTVIYRDTWGVPHIYAPSVEAGSYAMGWAQAEDRPEELLKNFLRAKGESAAVDGPEALQTDLVARLWDHYGVARRNLERVSDRARRILQAYVRGVNDYYRAHPEDVPPWWSNREVDEAMVIAFARLFLYSWSIDDGFGDLRRGGIQPDFSRELRASNTMVVGPERSAEGAPILVVDPHLSWWGISRFWEFRIHAAEFVASGFTLPGFPTLGLGHTRTLAWAMTTGGPDTADVYELEIRDGENPAYRFDGSWRPFEVREEVLDIAGVGTRRLTIWDSHLGPVVARQDSRAYVLRTAYAEEVGVFDAWLDMVFGETYEDVVRALEHAQHFPQNVMVADSAGNIYYQRTGRVPIRPEGFDWSRPVDGTTSRTDWQGIHSTEELVQLLNPARGYMQNCNVPPDAMLVGSPLTPEKYRDYIYSDRSHGLLGGWTNQRGARAVELLEADDSISAEEMQAIALDIHPYGNEHWREALRLAAEGPGAEVLAGYGEAYQEVRDWDGELSRESLGALKYFYWRKAIAESQSPEAKQIAEKLDDFMAPLRGEEKPLDLSPAELLFLAERFAAGMADMEQELGRLDLRYGEVFRVGRGERSWPVEGGGSYGTTTLRTVGFAPPRPDGTRWGTRGQTSTQVVVLSRPIRSWTAAPLGQSDREDSPHFADQAEKLFSVRQLKPTWWLPEELADHIASREVLEPPL